MSRHWSASESQLATSLQQHQQDGRATMCFVAPLAGATTLAGARLGLDDGHYETLRGAAREGDIVRVQELLLSGKVGELGMALDEGRTLLHCICQSTTASPSTRVDFIQFVCYHSPGLHSVSDDRGQTAAHYAAQLPSPMALMALFHLGASLSVYNPEGFTPLHYLALNSAVRKMPNQEVDALAALLPLVPGDAFDLPTAVTSETFLHLLIQRHQNILQQCLFNLLVPRLPDLCTDAVDFTHRRPVDYLPHLDSLASTSTSSLGWIKKTSQVFQVLGQSIPSVINFGETELLRAVTSLDVVRVHRLLQERPALLKTRTTSGFPLHMIAATAANLADPQGQAKAFPMLALLLSRMKALERIPCHPDGSHFLLIHSPSYPSIDLLRLYLLFDPLSVDRANLADLHPLHSAAYCRRADVVSLYLRAGANPNVTDRHLNTPLHIACLRTDLDCVHALLRGGARVTLQNAFKMTPLALLRWTTIKNRAVQSIDTLLRMFEALASLGLNLRLRGFGLTDHDVETLFSFLVSSQRCLDIRSVDLSDNKLTKPPPHLAHFRSLEALDLSGNWAAAPLKISTADLRLNALAVSSTGSTPHYDQLEMAAKHATPSAAAMEAALACDRKALQGLYGDGQVHSRLLINAFKESFLHAACISAANPSATPAATRLAFIQFLADRFKLSPNQADQEEVTPLLLAAQSGCLQTVSYLLELGAKPDVYPSHSRQTVLHALASLRRPHGDLSLLGELLGRILSAAPSLTEASAATTHNLPLHEVLSNPTFGTSPFLQTIFSFLLERSTGRALLAFNTSQACPLIIAAQNAADEAMRQIFARSQLLGVKYPAGILSYLRELTLPSSTVSVILEGQACFLEPLEQASSDWQPYHLYCAMGKLLSLQKLHSRMSEQHQQQHSQQQQQQHEERNQSIEGDVNLSTLVAPVMDFPLDGRGWSPVHVAALHGHKQILTYLRSCNHRQYSAELNRPVQGGLNPLHMAAANGDLELVEMLVEDPLMPPDIDFYTAETHAKTALHIAILRGHLEVAQYLLLHGADPSLPDLATGRSAMHLAALMRSDGLVLEMLKVSPASMVLFDLTDRYGHTPAQLWALQSYRKLHASRESAPRSLLPFFAAVNRVFGAVRTCFPLGRLYHTLQQAMLLSSKLPKAASSVVLTPGSGGGAAAEDKKPVQVFDVDLSSLELDEIQAEVLLRALGNNPVLKVRRLLLHSNFLKSVPHAITLPHHTHLTHVELHENPFVTGIQVRLAASRDPRDFREFYQRVEANPAAPLQEQWVLVLGPDMAGKSELIQALCESRSNLFERSRMRSRIVKQRAASTSVAISQVLFEFWELPSQLQFAAPGYHFCDDTLVLLAWDTSSCLSSIHAQVLDHYSRRSDRRQVLLVAVTGPGCPISETTLQEVLQPLKESFPALHEGYLVDLSDESSVAHLQATLHQSAVRLRPTSGLCYFDTNLLEILTFQGVLHPDSPPLIMFQQLVELCRYDATFLLAQPSVPLDLKILRSLQRLSRAGRIVFFSSAYQQKLRMASRSLREEEDRTLADLQNDLVVVIQPDWFFEFVERLVLDPVSGMRALRTPKEFQKLWETHTGDLPLSFQRKLYSLCCSLFLICPFPNTVSGDGFLDNFVASIDEPPFLATTSTSESSIESLSVGSEARRKIVLDTEDEIESGVSREMLGSAVGLFGLSERKEELTQPGEVVGLIGLSSHNQGHDSYGSSVSLVIQEASAGLRLTGTYFLLPYLLPAAPPATINQFWEHGPANEITVLSFERIYQLACPMPQSFFTRILSWVLSFSRPRYLWKDGGIADVVDVSRFEGASASESRKPKRAQSPSSLVCAARYVPKDQVLPVTDAPPAGATWIDIEVADTWMSIERQLMEKLQLIHIHGVFSARTSGAIESVELLRNGDQLLVKGTPRVPITAQIILERSVTADALKWTLLCTSSITTREHILAIPASACAFAAAALSEISDVVARCLWLDLGGDAHSSPSDPLRSEPASSEPGDDDERPSSIGSIMVPCVHCQMAAGTGADTGPVSVQPVDLLALPELSNLIASGESRVECPRAKAALKPSSLGTRKGSVVRGARPQPLVSIPTATSFTPTAGAGSSRGGPGEDPELFKVFSLRISSGVSRSVELVPISRLAPDLVLSHLSGRVSDASRVTLGEELGRGGFGRVHSCRISQESDSVEYACKTLEEASAFEAFRTECCRMSRFQHPNVVSLQGFLLSPIPLLVMALARGGDVYQLLHDPFQLCAMLDAFANSLGLIILQRDPATAAPQLREHFRAGMASHLAKVRAIKPLLGAQIPELLEGMVDASEEFFVEPTSRNHSLKHLITSSIMELHNASLDELAPLSWELRLRVAVDALRSLVYLHSLKPHPIAHLDFKTPNLLLRRNISSSLNDPAGHQTPLVQVCDFGLATPLDPSLFFQETLGGNPSEVMYIHPALSEVTPRWSSPEVLAGGVFHSASDIYAYGLVLWELITRDAPYGDLAAEGFEEGRILKAVLGGQHPPIPPTCPGSLAKLLRKCWQRNPEKRPPAHLLLQKLMKTTSKIAPQLHAILSSEEF